MKQKTTGARWLILLSVVSSVGGQIAIKLGVGQPGATQATSNLFSLIALIVTSPLLLLGFALYATGALAWIAVLSRFQLSEVYPFLALNMVLVAIVSVVVLGEIVPLMRWGGILIICLGLLLVARSSN